MPNQPYTLVTGATGAVGRSVVRVLADKMPLLLHGRDETKLNQLLNQCSGTYAHEVWPHDLACINGLGASLENTLKAKSIAVEGFVHCAGVAVVLPARGASFVAMWDCLNINFVSAQQIIASLLKKRVNPITIRSIVFISSIYSKVGVRGHSIYSASKAALDGLMRSLAVELAPATRVNSILPGALDTIMSASALRDPQVAANINTSYPLGIGLPDDIAHVVKFLISEDARWLTGQEFVVDGGRTINFSLK